MVAMTGRPTQSTLGSTVFSILNTSQYRNMHEGREYHERAPGGILGSDEFWDSAGASSPSASPAATACCRNENRCRPADWALNTMDRMIRGNSGSESLHASTPSKGNNARKRRPKARIL